MGVKRTKHKWFQFSPHRPVRARNIILQDICENIDLPSDNFKLHVVNWLPGNIPRPLSVHLFKLALNTLSSNTFISKAENLSFPYATSLFLPVSPTKKQEDENIISKLHH